MDIKKGDGSNAPSVEKKANGNNAPAPKVGEVPAVPVEVPVTTDNSNNGNGNSDNSNGNDCGSSRRSRP